MTAPHYHDDDITVYHGDCLDVLKTLPDNSIDAICTDPPYALNFMGKDWDSPSAMSKHFRGWGTNTPGARSLDQTWRQMGQFQQWCQLWATECLRVLKPGAHLAAFGGTRTWHRLACAVEDAGFEIRDNLCWLYGSGFPKSLDISKALDKRPGVARHAEFAAHLAERRETAGLSRADVSEHVVGTRSGACWNWEHHQFPEAKWWPALRGLLDMDGARWDAVIADADREITRAATRPAIAGEIITFDQRSSTERERRDIPATDAARQWQGWGTALKPAFEPIILARKPIRGTVAANILQHGTGGLNIDECRVEAPDADELAKNWDRTQSENQGSIAATGLKAIDLSDRAPAGRFPPNVLLDPTTAHELDKQSGNLSTCGGPKNTTHDAGLFGIGTPGHIYSDSGGASRFFPIFRYTAKAPGTERPTADGTTAHPCVKPLSLIRWLIRLTCPPHGTVLDPFAGTGTTAEAAIHEHKRCITIERTTDYLPLINARLDKPMQLGFDFDEVPA
jgi:DNA modification methylase